PAAVAFVVAGGVVAAALSPTYRPVGLVIGAPLLVHAVAQSGAVVPTWAGPGIALLALFVVLAGRRASASASRGHDPRALFVTQVAAATYAFIAIVYSMAAGGATSAVAAAPRVLDHASQALAGQWI